MKINRKITLYVLKGENGKRYIGITNDLRRRLNEHQLKKSKGSQVLGEFDVLYTEEFADHKSAREREKFLKSGQGRIWLNNLELQSEPAKAGKAILQGGLCASGAFKSSRPDQILFYSKFPRALITGNDVYLFKFKGHMVFQTPL